MPISASGVPTSHSSEGLARVQLGNKYGFIDRSGQMVINPQFGFAESFSEGLARVQLGNKYGFIDRSGQMVINPQFDSAGSFSEGLAAVELGDDSYRINKQGQILLDPTCVARPYKTIRENVWSRLLE